MARKCKRRISNLALWGLFIVTFAFITSGCLNSKTELSEQIDPLTVSTIVSVDDEAPGTECKATFQVNATLFATNPYGVPTMLPLDANILLQSNPGDYSIDLIEHNCPFEPKDLIQDDAYTLEIGHLLSPWPQHQKDPPEDEDPEALLQQVFEPRDGPIGDDGEFSTVGAGLLTLGGTQINAGLANVTATSLNFTIDVAETTCPNGTGCSLSYKIENGHVSSNLVEENYTATATISATLMHPYNVGLCEPVRQDDCAYPCPADVDHNGSVGMIDLTTVLAGWGLCPSNGYCDGDIFVSGDVNFTDLLLLLSSWGECAD